MDMYISMYDELKRSEDDNPTLGIVLCTETDEDIARYSVMLLCRIFLFARKIQEKFFQHFALMIRYISVRRSNS